MFILSWCVVSVALAYVADGFQVVFFAQKLLACGYIPCAVPYIVEVFFEHVSHGVFLFCYHTAAGKDISIPVNECFHPGAFTELDRVLASFFL